MEALTNEAIVKKPRSKAPWIVLGVLLAVLAAAYAGLCAYAASLESFYPNTTLNGVAIGGLDPAQAGQRLRQELPRHPLDFYLPAGLDADTGEPVYGETPAASRTYADFGVDERLDYEATTELCFRLFQREAPLPAKGLSLLKHLLRLGGPMSFLPEPDRAALGQAANALAKELSRDPLDAAYAVEEGGIQITKARDGLLVTPGGLEEQVLALLAAPAEDAVQVAASSLPARTLTAQEISDAVSGEVKNAGYDAAVGAITPERVGAEFDVSAAQSLLDAAAPGASVTVPAQVEFPKVTAQELEAVLFRDVLGECRTHVSGTAARISNVKLASAAFDGTVLNSGDVFSYNETVGQRTVAKGYQPAPAYVQGETVDEIGGGVCQPSSTLYYACLRANLEITERYAHRYVPAYIDWGMDATVSWGGPDYKFTNNTDYPIKISATYAKGYLTVQLLGTNVDGTYVRMTNEVLTKTPWETVYEDDPTLPAGTETVKVTPYTGYQVKSYRNLYGPDGKRISSDYEATSSYKVRNKVILRGPAVVAEPEAPVLGPAELPAETPVLPPELPPLFPEDPAEPAVSPTELPAEVPEEPPLPLQ